MIEIPEETPERSMINLNIEMDLMSLPSKLQKPTEIWSIYEDQDYISVRFGNFEDDIFFTHM